VFFLLIIAGAGYYYYKKQHKAPAPPAVVAPQDESDEDDLTTSAVKHRSKASKSEKKSNEPEQQGQESVFGTPVGGAPSGSSVQGSQNSSAQNQGHSNSPGAEKSTGSPIFDVAGFLQKGRLGMQRITKAPLTAYQQAIKANCQSLENQLGYEIRNFNISRRDALLNALRADAIQWQAAGYRVPESLPDIYSALDKSDAIHTAALKKQENLDKDLPLQLYKFSGSYIIGIQKQVDELRTQNDPDAIKMLEEEVFKVKGSPDYFASLVTGKSS